MIARNWLLSCRSGNRPMDLFSIAKEVGDRAREGSAYGYLGNAYLNQSNFKQAIEYYEKHLSIAKEVGDRAREGSAYGNLGSAHLNLGNIKQAIEYYKKNLSISKEVGDRAAEGSAYGNLGVAYRNLQSWSKLSGQFVLFPLPPLQC